MKKTKDKIKTNWSLEKALVIYNMPFNDLLYQAQTIHRENFKNNKIQMSTLLSVKTGSCPEDCAYCPQSAHHNTNLEKEKLISIEKVKEAAINAKAAGSTRFCLGAAWRSPTDNDLNTVCEMIKEVSSLGLETCVTLGMLKDHQAKIENAGIKKVQEITEVLISITKKIPKNINWLIQVEGHTDNIPISTEQYPSNWELSTARAIAVAKIMMKNGVSSDKINVAGYGEYKPLVENNNSTNREKNRRIELKLTQP